ncbi:MULTISPECIES: cell wall metabolism sensor histidine kinase WalK [Clostridium]|uniref:histidine kinase n=4 Tax=Clostridiaceae TaxID=31979 RepID=D8GTG2_CLOLD|nr:MULTISPECIES: ATP-binding protein [Clostridium]ADK14611.1 predicted sensor histidine kinase [Clostridium ljungdahlii DSM 13528]AGY77851.1 HAMP domain-containing histidine kinase [Clostridium autoethanogenum DSM 10061]ALU37985.1 putative sensor histidine kinase [Clostridium autoethanogenum DSM 10061]OAA85848.1 Signal transduction histidine-protein kinase ArlS [Clostridium ljungdahlii DSM 13528]OVY50749.1 Signal transduction histidine-protein kinase ArlS [Clostridium autoethanogenum]
MFKKLKLKLTFLNVGVFFILFLTFNVVIYLYAKSNIYFSIDKNLLISRDMIQRNMPQNSSYLSTLDPRVIAIVRDKSGKVILDTHINIFYRANQEYIKPTKVDQLYDINFKRFHFRSIAFSAQLKSETVMVQLLRNTNSEIEFLKNLLKIIIWGSIIVLLVCTLAGNLLAKRSMVPIVKAWEKQKRFVGDASHELRTPLTVIQAQLELVIRNSEDKIITKSENLGIALSETRRLSKLVADLLILTRSDSDAVEIDKKTVNMYLLIKKITDIYAEAADMEDKQVKTDLEKNLIVNCDEERIKQLMVILLDNAIKYTYRGGNIQVVLTQKDNKCIIYVKDDGIGIKSEEKELVFERFYRGDKSRNRETGGAGLGLSIAKWIVQKHEGTINIFENIPRGTVVEVVLKNNFS